MTTGKMMGSTLMTYVEAVAISAEVFAAMRHPNGSFLVPDSWERFWTEHSERATLASDLAALGVVKTFWAGGHLRDLINTSGRTMQ